MNGITGGESGGTLALWAELILDLRLANERRRYKVTLSLIGRAQTKNQSCCEFS